MKGPRYVETNISKLVNAEHQYQRHREKLNEIHSKKHHQDFNHMKVLKDKTRFKNYNFAFNEQERMNSIQKENDILLAHLMAINGFRLRNQSVVPVDTSPVKSRMNSEPRSHSPGSKTNLQRIQAQERIAQENIRIYNKIQSQVAQIPHKKYKEDWEKHLKAKGIMRKFFVENDQPAIRTSGIIKKLTNKNKTFSDQLSNRSSDREDSNKPIRQNSKNRLNDSYSRHNRTAEMRGSREYRISHQQKKENSKADSADVSKLLDFTQDRIILDISRPEASAEIDFQPRKERIRKSPKLIIQSSMNARVPTPKKTDSSFGGYGSNKTESRNGRSSREMRSVDVAKSAEYQSFKSNGYKESPFLVPLHLKSKQKPFEQKRINSPIPVIKNLRASMNNEAKVVARTSDRNSRNKSSNGNLAGNYSGRKSPIPNEIKERVDSKISIDKGSTSNLDRNDSNNLNNQGDLNKPQELKDSVVTDVNQPISQVVKDSVNSGLVVAENIQQEDGLQDATAHDNVNPGLTAENNQHDGVQDPAPQNSEL